MPTIEEQVRTTVARVLTDDAFAEQVRADGLAAVAAGVGSTEWETYFEHFAPTPNALAGLGAPSSASCTCNSNTVITLSTVTSPICGTCCAATTTTTTSGN